MSGPPTDTHEAMRRLVRTLWSQRSLIELLLFKLEVQRLVLASEQARWVDPATREVEAALDKLRHDELVRATQVRQVARQLGLDGDPTLAELADRAPSPWDAILLEHRAKFLDLIAEIEDAAASARELVRHGLVGARRFVAELEGQPLPPEYTRKGTGAQQRRPAFIVDREA